MGLIKEPLDVDFVVDPRPLTKKEQLAISEFIKADKAKRALLEKQPRKTKTKKESKNDRLTSTNRLHGFCVMGERWDSSPPPDRKDFLIS